MGQLVFLGETYRAIVSALFKTGRKRPGKMKKFVARWASLSYKSLQPSFSRSPKAYTTPPSVRYAHKPGRPVPRHRGPLLDQIALWLSEVPLEQLRKLPEMLRATQLNSVADKLEKAVSALNCTLIWHWRAILGFILPTRNYYWTVILIWNACWSAC